MSGSAASVAYLILAVFLSGVTLGVVAMVSVAIQERGPAVLPLRRGTRRGGTRRQTADPLRRGGLSLPAARLVVVMNDSVVAIVSAFFVIGITVGIITVFAMSALRTDRQGHRGRPPKYGTGAFDELPPDPGWDDADPDDQPRWPAKVDTHFRNG